MVGRNNNFQRLKDDCQKVNRYALRKTSLGLLSVMVATCLYFGGGEAI